MSVWHLLIFTLPSTNAAVRMRVWRASKLAGVGVLRDGVYALPAHSASVALLGELATDIEAIGGTAYLGAISPDPALQGRLRQLLDRSHDYAAFFEQLTAIKQTVDSVDVNALRRSLRQAKRTLDSITAIDYFPGPHAKQAHAAYHQLEQAAAEKTSPDEPHPSEGVIVHKSRKAYRRRDWATRRNLWVDRLASAWLIRRFIDAEANFVWLEKISALPKRAVGFDFDGAEFTHVGTRVTFEVLMQSFQLDGDAALIRVGEMVHFLDVGGLPVAEAAGFEAMLRGLKKRCADDDALLAEGGQWLDDLYSAFGGASACQANP